ncbi:hypothetical protein A2U01_0059340, partial [Trifolium medium]|nr:hypothetical protein [Trifolium medium]
MMLRCAQRCPYILWRFMLWRSSLLPLAQRAAGAGATRCVFAVDLFLFLPSVQRASLCCATRRVILSSAFFSCYLRNAQGSAAQRAG